MFASDLGWKWIDNFYLMGILMSIWMLDCLLTLDMERGYFTFLVSKLLRISSLDTLCYPIYPFISLGSTLKFTHDFIISLIFILIRKKTQKKHGHNNQLRKIFQTKRGKFGNEWVLKEEKGGRRGVLVNSH